MAEQSAASPRDEYQVRFERHEARRGGAARRSLVLSNVRAATFMAIVATLVLFEELSGPGAWLVLGLGVALGAGFAGLVVVHRRVRRAERREQAFAQLAREGLLRLERDWSQLESTLPAAERKPEEPGPDHAYARDLSVFGRASLVRLLGPVTSERGRALLRSWLLEPAGPEVVAARQGAVRELATRVDFRAELAVRGRLDGPETLEGLGRFFTWSEAQPGEAAIGVRIGTWILPPLLIGGLVGYFVAGWPPWWILPAAAQFEVLRRTRRGVADTLAGSAAGGPPLRALVPQLEVAEAEAWTAPALVALGDRLGHGEDAAHRHLGRLSALLDTVESRRNAFYAMLAPVLLLDLHLASALTRWRAVHGHSARDWIEALGEIEALSALATLAHDHPDWAHPRFEPGAASLDAARLGHPLLRPDRCVRNDVSVGPSGRFLLVTGSNMSGKSTLLRALGSNAVLAAAGAPVCADALTLPPVRVHTAMVVQDSLAEGISLFMAELLRIKSIVEAAADGDGGEGPVLYLLDEILHGTNTAERRTAARGVLRHLLQTSAIGAVSTHDLTLADAEDLVRAAEPVHFREDVVRGDGSAGATRLTFDYRLREGIATTRNALKLLEAVGLGGLDLGE